MVARRSPTASLPFHFAVADPKEWLTLKTSLNTDAFLFQGNYDFRDTITTSLRPSIASLFFKSHHSLDQHSFPYRSRFDYGPNTARKVGQCYYLITVGKRGPPGLRADKPTNTQTLQLSVMGELVKTQCQGLYRRSRVISVAVTAIQARIPTPQGWRRWIRGK